MRYDADNGVQKRTLGSGVVLTWVEFCLYHLANGHIGKMTDLLVPQFPHFQKAENST